MHIHSRTLSIIIIGILASICAGCGGGGGGSAPVSPPSQTLALTAASPALTGKTGQIVTIPISVAGVGSVNTASVDVKVSAATYEPAVTSSSTPQDITDLPATAAACYVWLDTQTIRVLYVSADGAPSGSVLVNVPVKVKSETPAAPTLANIALNK